MKPIEYKPSINLNKILGKDNVACENNVISIYTTEGWKIPKEGDFIKETEKGYQLITSEEIKEQAYNFSNILYSTCPLDIIEKYYIDMVGVIIIRKIISVMAGILEETDKKDMTQINNFLRLVAWFENRYKGE